MPTFANNSRGAWNAYLLDGNQSSTLVDDSFDYIIDVGGDGDYTSIYTAVNAQPAGTSFYIRNGTYLESENIILKDNMKLIGENQKKVIVDRTLDNTKNFQIDGVDGVIIENITVENQNTSIGAFYLNNTNYTQIKNINGINIDDTFIKNCGVKNSKIHVNYIEYQNPGWNTNKGLKFFGPINEFNDIFIGKTNSTGAQDISITSSAAQYCTINFIKIYTIYLMDTFLNLQFYGSYCRLLIYESGGPFAETMSSFNGIEFYQVTTNTPGFFSPIENTFSGCIWDVNQWDSTMNKKDTTHMNVEY